MNATRHLRILGIMHLAFGTLLVAVGIAAVLLLGQLEGGNALFALFGMGGFLLAIPELIAGAALLRKSGWGVYWAATNGLLLAGTLSGAPAFFREAPGAAAAWYALALPLAGYVGYVVWLYTRERGADAGARPLPRAGDEGRPYLLRRASPVVAQQMRFVGLLVALFSVLPLAYGWKHIYRGWVALAGRGAVTTDLGLGALAVLGAALVVVSGVGLMRRARWALLLVGLAALAALAITGSSGGLLPVGLVAYIGYLDWRASTPVVAV